MKTIEINGKEVNIYESLYEYVKDADISDYVLKYGVNEICPSDDPNWYGNLLDDLGDEIAEYAIDHDLIGANWGEQEISLIPKDELYYVVYVIGREDGSWDSAWKFFKSREDAEKAHQEDIDEKIQDLLKDLREHEIPEDRIQDLMEDEGKSVFICANCGRILDVDYDLRNEGRIYFSCPEYVRNGDENHTSFSLDQE